MAANSPYESAAVTVMKPVTAQAAISSAGEFVMRAISADTIKMPEPIIEQIDALVGPATPHFAYQLRARVRELVSTHAVVPAGLAPDVRVMHERQRDLFEASLRAALTVDELQGLATPLGIPAGAVRMTSDRHWTLSCVKP